MAGFDYDLFVIGGGSGGVRAARMSAQYGAKVALAEEFRYGGTCVIRGCVPKKLLVYASSYSEHFEDAKGFGWTVGESSFDWTKLISAKNTEIGRLEGVYESNLERAGVELHKCRATVVDPHTVRLASDGREVTAKYILVATGGAPFVPDFPGSEHAGTSNEALDLPSLPRKVIVVGGGYVACEFACIFKGMGVDVTQIYRRDLFLRSFDMDLRQHLAESMKAKGIDLRFNIDITEIRPLAEGYEATLTDGSKLEADFVMYATGRNPNTAGLGLEVAGVSLSPNGAVEVDAYSQSSVPSIYAVGDVTDRLALTPVAIREGAAFTDTVFGAQPTKADHSNVATAVFTQPEIGTVGLSEELARAEYDVEIYRSTFRPMIHTLSGRDEKMLLKMIVDKASRRVLGIHIVGHGAGEMIQLAGVAVKMGATKEDFDRTVAVHPTAAEELVTMRDPVA